MVKSFRNGGLVPLAEIPTLPFAAFREALAAPGLRRMLALMRLPDGRIVAVLGDPAVKRLGVCATPEEGFQDLTDEMPALHRFLRELRGEADLTPFVPLKGGAAHEVAVGPVHAGVIEPGHFRFQCMGEDVHRLEIQLGYQRRGAEALIASAGSDARRLALAETVAGDTSVAAALVCRRVLGLPLPHPRRAALLLELERIANHAGDLGALSGDVAYLPTASFCGRIRGEYLNMTAEFCGSRFGRGATEPTLPAISDARWENLRVWFERTRRELFHAVGLLFREAGAVERLENTGRVSAETARAIGLVGVAGRASGLAVDSRVDFPFADESVTDTLVADGGMTGDVLSRARQRLHELEVSHRIVARLLAEKPAPAVASEAASRALTAPALSVAAIESWRGELVHLAVRDASGVAQYRIFDPSFHNWFGLAQALRGEQISNFPICNKSFNLSYCGVDR